jgi:hypothetical protein
MDMKTRTKRIHKLFEAKAMEKPKRSKAELKMLAKDILALHRPDELWCAWCKKWGNHRSGNCPDKDSKMLGKMFRDCGRPIKFSDVFTTELDCVAENDKCKSTTPNLKRKL